MMGTVPDDLKNVVRGMPPQHQPHQQPMRLNSFGEESLDSLLGDSLGMYVLFLDSPLALHHFNPE